MMNFVENPLENDRYGNSSRTEKIGECSEIGS